jgi:hypothetical protein
MKTIIESIISFNDKNRSNSSNGSNDNCHKKCNEDHEKKYFNIIMDLQKRCNELEIERDDWKAKCINSNSNKNNKNTTTYLNAPKVNQNIFDFKKLKDLTFAYNNINLQAISTVFNDEIEKLCSEMRTHYRSYSSNDSDIDENGTSKIIAMDVRCAPNLFAIILKSLFSRDVSRVVDRSPSIITKLR